MVSIETERIVAELSKLDGTYKREYVEAAIVAKVG